MDAVSASPANPTFGLRLRQHASWVLPVLLVVAGNCGLCLWPLAAGVRRHVFGVSMQVAVAIGGGVLLAVRLTLTGAAGRRHVQLRRERDAAITRAEHAESLGGAARDAVSRAVEEHLAVMLYELGFGVGERVSLYAVDPGLSRFSRSARYSANPSLRDGGAMHLPLDQGVLGKALAEGHYRVSLQFSTESERHREHATVGLLSSTTRVRGLRMRSKEYFAFALKDPVTNSFGAVIVWESTDVGKMKYARVKSIMASRGEPLMRMLLASTAAAGPQPRRG
jgi:hypothetical protein